MEHSAHKRLLLVGNPTAQSGKAKARISRAQSLLTSEGFVVDTLDTAPHGRTVSLVAIALDEAKYDVVVALGGDGTFAEVGKGILAAKHKAPLGLMPSGTGNDQGKSFGISSKEERMSENARIIAAGCETNLDVGRVESFEDGQLVASEIFFDSLGFGIQSEILQQRNRDRDLVEKVPFLRDVYRDQVVYAGATLAKYVESFFEPTKFDASIVADGLSYDLFGLTDVIIKNTAVYGGSWILARESFPDDGKFELIPMTGRRDWFSKILRDHQAIPLWQEDFDLLGVTHSEGTAASSFELHLSRPAREDIHVQLDGEEWICGHHFKVEVEHGELPILTPANFIPPWKT
ncbi:MAG: hypothetical protein GY822_06610 [Deltaproteobacteria bacterium]|nr:hypothetical protein [Deltaproteobacteria bacterium]